MPSSKNHTVFSELNSETPVQNPGNFCDSKMGWLNDWDFDRLWRLWHAKCRDPFLSLFSSSSLTFDRFLFSLRFSSIPRLFQNSYFGLSARPQNFHCHAAVGGHVPNIILETLYYSDIRKGCVIPRLFYPWSLWLVRATWRLSFWNEHMIRLLAQE